MLGLNFLSFRSNSLWKWPRLLELDSLHICLGSTIESILTLLFCSFSSSNWKCDLGLYLLSDCVDTFTLSWQLLSYMSTFCSVAMPRVLQSGASSSVNLGGRYLCS